MSRFTFILFACFVVFSTGYADENNPPQVNDSIRLEEVIVTGTLPKVNLRNVPMSISRVC